MRDFNHTISVLLGNGDYLIEKNGEKVIQTVQASEAIEYFIK